MLIKLISTQVVDFWEVIKFAVTRVDEVDSKDLQLYLNELLHALLSDKAQCFVRLSKDRIIIALCITRIRADKITGKKYLFIQNVYSFKATIDETWTQDADFLKEFAKKEKCSYLSFYSRNKRIWELGEMVGFKERYRVFNFRLKE